MSDDSTRLGKPAANEEQGDEVEAHGSHPAASDEGPTEDQDDFEAHMKREGPHPA